MPMPTFVRTLFPASRAPILLLAWGCAWFALSVIIFYLGCILPSLQSKPPPLVQRPRSAKRRSPSPPLSANPESLPAQPEAEDEPSSSVTFTPPLQRSATMAEVSSSSEPHKRPGYKALWSFAHHPARSLAGTQPPNEDLTPAMRRAATVSDVLSSLSSASPPKVPTLKAMVKTGIATFTPRNSISSESESTLVDALSPSRYHPGLPMIASASPSAEGRYAQDGAGPAPPSSSASPSPSGSPRSSRRARLPSMKIFKPFARRSSKHKVNPIPRSPTPETVSLDDTVDASSSRAATPEDRERPRQAHPGHLEHDLLTGEVLTTKFVNPFRTKPRKSHSVERSALSPLSPAPRRASGPRRMLASLQLSHANDSRASSVPDSPRSSVSSVSTGYSTFSSPSAMSTFSGSSNSPRSLPRTQPYAAPYYAAMPAPRDRSNSRPSSRRAASLTLDRPATVAEESGEEGGNALGLELGHGQPRGRAVTVPTVHRKPFFRHRVAASEGAPLAAAAR